MTGTAGGGPSIRAFDEVSADDLRILTMVARTGRLTTAAAALGVQHTTVRRRIDRLERGLGVRLLARSADGWSLTGVGSEVVDQALAIETALLDVSAVVGGRTRDRLRGRVRLLVPDAFGVVFAAPALGRLHARSPLLEIELLTAARGMTPRAAGVDLAVTIGRPSIAGLETRPLARYRLGLYATDEYLATHRAVVTVDDLRHHSLISYVDDFVTVPDLELRGLVNLTRSSFGASSPFAQLAATRAGAGIGLLHAFVADRERDLVPVLREAISPTLEFSLARRRDSPQREALTAVTDALIEEVETRREELLPPQ